MPLSERNALERWEARIEKPNFSSEESKSKKVLFVPLNVCCFFCLITNQEKHLSSYTMDSVDFTHSFDELILLPFRTINLRWSLTVLVAQDNLMMIRTIFETCARKPLLFSLEIISNGKEPQKPIIIKVSVI